MPLFTVLTDNKGMAASVAVVETSGVADKAAEVGIWAAWEWVATWPMA